MDKMMIGDKDVFAIEYAFIADGHSTEISMYIGGCNILAFEKDGKAMTTRWDLDELAEWLRQFINNMTDDPYPVECEGMYAAQKDEAARDFDTDDVDELEAYYQKLYDWNLRHRWHPASSGAILANVYFQLVGNYVEISWDNQNGESGVEFCSLSGGARILRTTFFSVVDQFLKAYALHWFAQTDE